jgi:hypothetical protein
MAKIKAALNEIKLNPSYLKVYTNFNYLHSKNSDYLPYQL